MKNIQTEILTSLIPFPVEKQRNGQSFTEHFLLKRSPWLECPPTIPPLPFIYHHPLHISPLPLESLLRSLDLPIE
ncbi:unnamed protein product [Nezara viridula]|uniref:Uncharacterized protein n=1 Tax=Nezara viridula TaxID=85310 RepID=A0A9P0E2C1_NEZVI|nr:unnamed protein product [Nezara viridula]